MFKSKKEKELIDRELELYKQEKLLEINKSIHAIKETGWKTVDQTRQDINEKIRELKVELTDDNVSRPAVAVELEMLRAENKYLKETVALFARSGNIHR